MLLNKTADKLVFKFLSKIKNGYLEITTYEGEILKLSFSVIQGFLVMYSIL